MNSFCSINYKEKKIPTLPPSNNSLLTQLLPTPPPPPPTPNPTTLTHTLSVPKVALTLFCPILCHTTAMLIPYTPSFLLAAIQLSGRHLLLCNVNTRLKTSFNMKYCTAVSLCAKIVYFKHL